VTYTVLGAVFVTLRLTFDCDDPRESDDNVANVNARRDVGEIGMRRGGLSIRDCANTRRYQKGNYCYNANILT
jgi:hypothetical protein